MPEANLLVEKRGSGAVGHPGSLPGDGKVLAGRAAGEQGHALELRPVQLGYVPEERNIGPPGFQDAARKRIPLGVGHALPARRLEAEG